MLDDHSHQGAKDNFKNCTEQSPGDYCSGKPKHGGVMLTVCASEDPDIEGNVLSQGQNCEQFYMDQNYSPQVLPVTNDSSGEGRRNGERSTIEEER